MKLDGADRHPLHSDEELVRRWLHSATRRPGAWPLWSHVAEAFSVGSTSAREICRRHGHDPEQQVRTR